MKNNLNKNKGALSRERWYEVPKGLFIVITAIAFFLRLWQLDKFPVG